MLMRLPLHEPAQDGQGAIILTETKLIVYCARGERSGSGRDLVNGVSTTLTTYSGGTNISTPPKIGCMGTEGKTFTDGICWGPVSFL